MEPFEREILELIAAHDKEYSWYQLDRALAAWSVNRERNLISLRGLPRVLRGLEEQGFVSSETGHHPSQPVYSITDKGKRAIGVPSDTSPTKDIARRGHPSAATYRELSDPQIVVLTTLYTELEAATDDLPYTPEFERLFSEFNSRTGLSLDRHDLWKALCNARKAGKLTRKMR
jgi:hypothetical protein